MDYIDDLVTAVETTSARLREVSQEASARRPAPGRWSAKEIIGHLIDSASHNHQRFLRARFQEDLVFPGYEQEAWVSEQNYQEAPWDQLITLWQTMNLHLARVMANTPEAIRLRPRLRHNLHEIAWKAVPAHEPATLDYFMRDYVGHLRHHLRQIDAALAQRAGV